MSRWVAGPATLAALVIAAGVAGVRVNFTRSMPVGLYRTVPHAAPVRGVTVVACLPPSVAALARARAYLPRGDCPGGVWPVGKPVAAAAGDTVDVGAAGLVVNGRVLPNSRPLAADAAGRPIAAVPHGRYVVPCGALWLVSSFSARSYDSRYFGAVPVAGIRAVVRPLWATSPAPMPATAGGPRGLPIAPAR